MRKNAIKETIKNIECIRDVFYLKAAAAISDSKEEIDFLENQGNIYNECVEFLKEKYNIQ